ncbi:MAG: fatty acid desaturase family protein [Prosthecobacter sp.]|uniref:fatty acid desaturase family protein n=1 Tax=Prosthecobacter sp. TaxID=1965333 RepID=UPI0039002764
MNTAPTIEPHWVSRSAFQIVVFLFLFTEIALVAVLRSGASLWWAVPLVLLASHLMHGAAVGFHEATHGLLRRNRRFNEFDGVLLGIFSFMSFSLYRAAHQTHHAYFATERDEELWPFVFTQTPRWARILAAVLELTVGLLFTPFLFLRSFLRAGSPIRSKKVRRRIWKELALMIVVWIGIITAVSYWQVWHYFLWMYLAPAYLAANLQSWRKYVEHVGLTGSTVNSATRHIISEGWLGRIVSFTLLHEPYHGVHHLHVGLSHAELPQRAAELLPTTPDERPPFPSYRHAMLDVLRCLADPRVGAQWHTSAKPS